MSSKTVVLNPACIKTLSAVEARPERSNQHEFNGVAELKNIFGPDKKEFSTVFSIRGEDVAEVANATWYDAREKHATRSEYRFYFQSNKVMQQARENDNVIIGFDGVGTLHCILIRSGSSGHKPGISNWQKV